MLHAGRRLKQNATEAEQYVLNYFIKDKKMSLLRGGCVNNAALSTLSMLNLFLIRQ